MSGANVLALRLLGKRSQTTLVLFHNPKGFPIEHSVIATIRVRQSHIINFLMVFEDTRQEGREPIVKIDSFPVNVQTWLNAAQGVQEYSIVQ